MTPVSNEVTVLRRVVPWMLSILLLALCGGAGCTISDSGCAADVECREGRICDNRQCIWLGDFNPDGPDDQNNGGTNNGGTNNGFLNNGDNNGGDNNGFNNNGFNNPANNGFNNGSANNGFANNGFNNGSANNGVVVVGEMSCDHLAQTTDARLDSGYYGLVLPNGQEELVYCWFDEFGQGWTLVGRSSQEADPAAAFGWSTDTGRADGTGAYSRDLIRMGLRFTEVLLAERSDADRANEIGDNAYVIRPFPGNFASGWNDRSTANLDVMSIRGTCGVTNVHSFRHFGHTALQTHFFMNDSRAVGNFGLFPTGFRFGEGNNPTCYSGFLDGHQGLVFVR